MNETKNRGRVILGASKREREGEREKKHLKIFFLSGFTNVFMYPFISEYIYIYLCRLNIQCQVQKM